MARNSFDELREALKKEVHELGSTAGAAHLVLRRGKCVLALADGWANKKKGKRFALNSICKLHGCSKPLVAAAFLTLVDSGKVRLNDPVDKYIPFSGDVMQKTSRGVTSVKKVISKPTLRNLLTMTAGLKYDSCPAYDKIMGKIRRRRAET
eukprot:TRINITY_DN18227_c0_g1_i3.p1 TRINITY_DN18227_c0_g1~~TRINITY_DN18227_c0_g1_i3.p1  ORF type:complete len:151 (-),score=27.38 TRINITY_DN18227_c0_g1_i3:205-657(-)